MKERHQSPELSRRRPHAHALAGRCAETGRSAMNGNDGPFACAACKLVFEHQNAAAHSAASNANCWCTRGWCAILCGCQKKASTSVASPASRRSQRRAQRGRPAAPPAGRLACGAPGPGWRLMSARPHRQHRHLQAVPGAAPMLPLALVASAHGAVRVLEQAVRAAGGAGPWE